MKSSGIECTAAQSKQGQHEFLFSLRSLHFQGKPKMNIKLEFANKSHASDQVLNDQTSANKISFDPCTLLPSFSRGSQTAFSAFRTVSDISDFQSWNKQMIENLAQNAYPQKLEKQQMRKAKPNFTYCQICRETFSDYLKHLQHPVHIRKFQTQGKSKMMDDLLKNIEQQSKSMRRGRCVRQEEEDEDAMGSPQKIRVIQMQDTLTPMRVNFSHQRIEKRRGNVGQRTLELQQ